MRYKGRSSEKTDFPHVVEIVVPLSCFGRKLDTMHAHLHGVAYTTDAGDAKVSRTSGAGCLRFARTPKRSPKYSAGRSSININARLICIFIQFLHIESFGALGGSTNATQGGNAASSAINRRIWSRGLRASTSRRARCPSQAR